MTHRDGQPLSALAPSTAGLRARTRALADAVGLAVPPCADPPTLREVEAEALRRQDLASAPPPHRDTAVVRTPPRPHGPVA